MPLVRRVSEAVRILDAFVRRPRMSLRVLRGLPDTVQALAAYREGRLAAGSPHSSQAASTPVNPLLAYFDSHSQGRGVWKWRHYFDIYHRHFSKFIGREVHVLEVGVYSAGSLQMWREYFGPQCRVYGVDISPACKQYEDDSTRIFIGDQSDRAFWASVKRDVPRLDILIDDGGHRPEQQIITLEETLLHLRPGGVYLCEDVHGTWNTFSAYVQGLALNLNAFSRTPDPDRCPATRFQKAVHSVHTYPFVTVIERTESAPDEFVAQRRGSEWTQDQP